MSWTKSCATNIAATKHHLPSVKRLDSCSKMSHPAGLMQPAVTGEALLHLKMTDYERSSWLSRSLRTTLITLYLRGASSDWVQEPELKSGYYLCNKHTCHGLKGWKPGSSGGFGGISPPASQHTALGGNMLLAPHSSVFSSLTFSCFLFLRANAKKEGICNSGDVKFSELSFSTDTEIEFPKFNS